MGTSMILCFSIPFTSIYRAYVQFRGSEFHTINERFWQSQEQRRAKAHSRQAKFDRLKLFSRLGLKPQTIFCRP